MGVEAAIIGTTAFTMYNQYAQNKAQAKAAKANASIKEKMALEQFERSEFNISQITKDALRFKAKQEVTAAASGASGGNVLMALEDTNAKLVEAVEIEKREADWRATAIRAGAALDLQQAKEIKKSLFPNLAGTALQAGASYYGAKR